MFGIHGAELRLFNDWKQNKEDFSGYLELMA